MSRSPAPGHASPALGLLAIAAAAALWALAAVVARRLFDAGLDPIELTAARSWIAVIGLALLPGARRPRAGGATGGGRGRILAAVVVLGLSFALVNATYYLAIQRLDVAVALVLQYLAPVLVVSWTFLSTRMRPEPAIVAALVASVMGVVLVSELSPGSIAQADLIGVALGLGSAVLFAMYTLLSQSVSAVYGVQGALFRGFLVAAGFWLVAQATRGWPGGLLEPSNVPAVLFVTIGGTFVPFLLYLWGIEQVRAERASIAATLEPVLGAVAAWIWLQQQLSVVQLLGGALVLGAVLTLQLRRRSPARVEPAPT